MFALNKYLGVEPSVSRVGNRSVHFGFRQAGVYIKFSWKRGWWTVSRRIGDRVVFAPGPTLEAAEKQLNQKFARGEFLY